MIRQRLKTIDSIRAAFGLGILAALLFQAAPATAAMSGDDAGFAPSDSRTVVVARKQMVASANPHASKAGLDMLRAGGSAADALVAMQAMLTLVEPQSSGLGGSSYVVYFDAAKKSVATYDGRVAFPAAATEDWLRGSDGKYYKSDDLEAAGLAVGVPGTVRTLEAVHRRFGKLPWKTLFEPAIALAESGFEVSPRLHLSIRSDKHLKQSPSARAFYLDQAGKPLAVGTRLVNRPLAATLRRIAELGADGFYTGEIAEAVAAAVRTTGHLPAPMTAADLAAYRTVERPPVCEPYRTWKVCAMGPSSSGGTVVQMLKLLERFDLASLGPNSPQAVHLMAEAGKLARADRAQYMADPDFVPDMTRALLDPAYVKSRSDLIDRERSLGKAASGKPTQKGAWLWAPSEDRDIPSTTQLAAVDAEGNAFSMTTSVGGNFGARILVGGFMLNNQAGDATGVPRLRGVPRVNRPEAGKRVRSTMAPVLIFDREGKLAFALGSPGGGAIEDYVLKTILGVLDWNLDVQQAINLPNRGNRNGPTELEKGTPLAGIAPALKAMGHDIKIVPMTSGIQGIAVREGMLMGGADPRREGVALGD